MMTLRVIILIGGIALVARVNFKSRRALLICFLTKKVFLEVAERSRRDIRLEVLAKAADVFGNQLCVIC